MSRESLQELRRHPARRRQARTGSSQEPGAVGVGDNRMDGDGRSGQTGASVGNVDEANRSQPLQPVPQPPLLASPMLPVGRRFLAGRLEQSGEVLASSRLFGIGVAGA
jgi:hypothetical protein